MKRKWVAERNHEPEGKRVGVENIIKAQSFNPQAVSQEKQAVRAEAALGVHPPVGAGGLTLRNGPDQTHQRSTKRAYES